MDSLRNRKVIILSRCAWTLYNFRGGLIKSLLKKGYVVLGGGAGGDGFESKVKSLGIDFVPLPISKRPIAPLSDCVLFWTLFRRYRRERPAIVHHFTIRPIIYGNVAAWLAGVPRILSSITGLGTVFGEDEKWWLRAIVEVQYRLALSVSHMTFFQNEEDCREFTSRGLITPPKSRVVPGSGVDCEEFKPWPLQEFVENRSVLFLLSARLIWEKGIGDFVEAARLVRRLYPATTFQLLGRRDLRNPNVIPQEAIEKWESEGIVQWLGEVADVRPILAQADVVVLPTYYREGVPRALLEGAAMGKPIIATDTVGCRDVVDQEKNGLLVPIKNPQALAGAMIRLIEDPDLRIRMGQEGRKRIQQQFNEQSVINCIVESYQ